MALAINLFNDVWRRSVFALLLAAFLVPAPMPTHADEMRALYAAQGLLCAPKSDDQPHREAHCVLCILPAAGAPPECALAERRLTVEVVAHAVKRHLTSATSVRLHRARSPPRRIV